VIPVGNYAVRLVFDDLHTPPQPTEILAGLLDEITAKS
jgi:hypothetical protein